MGMTGTELPPGMMLREQRWSASAPKAARSVRALKDLPLEVVPSTTDATAVLLEQFTERNRHLLLDDARVVDVTGDCARQRLALSESASERRAREDAPQKSLVPWFLSRPKPANQAPPLRERESTSSVDVNHAKMIAATDRRAMVGATATDSTLATVVAHPKRPEDDRAADVSVGLACCETEKRSSSDRHQRGTEASDGACLRDREGDVSQKRQYEGAREAAPCLPSIDSIRAVSSPQM